MMALTYLYLNDECPRIGCGRRGVEVLKQGWKWVQVAYRPAGPNGHTIKQRIRKEVFECLVTPGGIMPDEFRPKPKKSKKSKG